MISKRLTPFAMVLVSGSLAAAGRPALAPAQLAALKAQQPVRTELALGRLDAARPSLGLGSEVAFQTRRADTDAFGILHVHVHQTYKGVSVWGGDAILHLDAKNTPLPLTDKLVRDLDLGVTPAIGTSEALAIAARDMGAKAGLSHQDAPELVVVPRTVRSLRADVDAAAANASDVVTTVTGADLAYHIHLETRSQGDTRSMDYLVSALNGTLLKKWSSLETAAATGTGHSQYSGTVSVTTNQLSASSYEMRDPNRGNTTVTDLANGTSGTGTVYTDADNTWGDGQNFYDDGTSGATSGVTGQTAAVDAKFGFQATWDYYKNVHGRNGIDNTGKATTLRMHYASRYDNAFWSDSCFCMTFGDGGNTSASPSGDFNNLTALDVIGHELSHGVIANSVSGGLNYYDESGGLNEADSDINGTFVTYYGYNGGTGTTVPNTIPGASLHGYTPWTIGSQLANPPLRYMYKPSLDGGFSPDAWTFDIGQLDPHASSGPMNRAMYFLAQGASATSTDDTYSSYLPSGMTGIGNDAASAIWYYVMTHELTSASDYHDARVGAIAAAIALYGGTPTAPSTEVAAVQNAFHGINVGPVAGQADDTQAPTGVTASESGTAGNITLGASGTDNVAITRVVFTIDGVDMAQLNGTGTTLFDSHQIGNGSHSLVATAYDDYRNAKASAPITFSTLNSYSQLLSDPGFESGGIGWTFAGTFAIVDSTDISFAHSGNAFALLCGQGKAETSTVSTSVAVPAGVKSSLTFWVRTYTGDASGVAHDKLQAQVISGGATTTLATYANNDATANGWTQETYDLSAFAGKTITLKFTGTENADATPTYFMLDDFALDTQWAQADEDGSGSVDGIDLGRFAKDYGTAGPLSDFNNDGVVNDSDATILLNAFGK